MTADAAAAGTTAIVSLGSITGIVGNAVAAGVTALPGVASTLTCGVGNAVASGTQATVGTHQTVSGIVGAALAAGATASLVSDFLVACAAGNASAGGTTATVGLAGGSAEAVWDYLLPNGMPAGEVVAEVHLLLSELHLIHGLTAGSPLVVAPASRTAGLVSQTVGEVGTVVTVTRN